MAGDRNRFQTAMNQAGRLAQQGNWPEAMKAYRFALAEFPNDPAAVVGFGEAALFGGQVDFAWKAFQQALKLNPSNDQALHYMGEIQEQKGEVAGAAETYLRVGNILSGKDQLPEAIKFWSRAIRLVPGHVDAHYNLAHAFAQQGETLEAARQLLILAATYQARDDFDRARECVLEADELLPDHPGIKAALDALSQGQPILPDQLDELAEPEAELEFELGDQFRESTLFEEDPFAALEIEPDTGKRVGLIEAARQKAMAELANVIFEDDQAAYITATIPREEVNRLIIQAIDLQSRSEFKEAISRYQEVVRVGAGRPALYFNLGLLYKEQSQFDQAARVLKLAAQDKGYRVSAQIALGETYYIANNLELAVRYFIEALKMVDIQTVRGDKINTLVSSYEQLVEEYVAQRDTGKINSFISALEKFFANPDWETNVYEARERMNSVAENGSVMSLAEFLETPETEVVITAIAVTGEYIKRNMLMTAAEECLRAIQKAPSYLPLHARLAEILLKQERTDEAITKYLHISEVYQMRNQPDQSIGILQKVLRLAPMDVTVRSKLIDLYVAHHKLEQALDQYLMLADSYYQLAQVDRALEKYNEALRLLSNLEDARKWKVEILNRMGDIYNQRFDWARATAAFEELFQADPDDERVQRQLVDLYFKRSNTNQAINILNKLLGTYKQRQQPERALELLRDLSSIYPDNLSIRQQLAEAYLQNNRRREAIAEYDALGEMQLENGLRDQARQTIQTIINLGPDDIEGYRRLLAQISGGAA